MGFKEELSRRGVRLHDGIMMISLETEADLLRNLGISSPPADVKYQKYDSVVHRDKWLVIRNLLKVSTDSKEINSIREVIADVVNTENKDVRYFSFDAPKLGASFSELSKDISEMLEKFRRQMNRPGAFVWQAHRQCLSTFSATIHSEEDYQAYLKFERYVPFYRYVMKNKDGYIDTEVIDAMIAGYGFKSESVYSYIAAFCAQYNFAVSLYSDPNSANHPSSNPTVTYTAPKTQATQKPYIPPQPEYKPPEPKPFESYQWEDSNENKSGSSGTHSKFNRNSDKSKVIWRFIGMVICLAVAIYMTYWLLGYTASLDAGNPHCMASMLYAFPAIITVFGILGFGRPESYFFLPTVLLAATIIMFYVIVVAAMTGGYAPSAESTTNSLVMSSWIVITIILILSIVGMFTWIGLAGCVIMSVAGVIICLGVFNDFGDSIALMMATLAGILVPTTVASGISMGLLFGNY